MLSRRASCLALALSLALVAACGDDDNGEPVTIDLNGSWVFTVDVTVANGVCAGEENDVPEPFAVEFITIDSNGDGTYDVTVTGDFGSDGGSISGTVTGVPQVGDRIVLSGSYPEDGGVTTTTHTLTVKSATRLEGTEAWSWEGTGGTCPNSAADVVVNKVP